MVPRKQEIVAAPNMQRCFLANSQQIAKPGLHLDPRLGRRREGLPNLAHDTTEQRVVLQVRAEGLDDMSGYGGGRHVLLGRFRKAFVGHREMVTICPLIESSRAPPARRQSHCGRNLPELVAQPAKGAEVSEHDWRSLWVSVDRGGEADSERIRAPRRDRNGRSHRGRVWQIGFTRLLTDGCRAACRGCLCSSPSVTW